MSSNKLAMDRRTGAQYVVMVPGRCDGAAYHDQEPITQKSLPSTQRHVVINSLSWANYGDIKIIYQ